MLTVAALKRLLEDVPESVDTVYGKIPTWVMLRTNASATPAEGPRYAHCHITPGGSINNPVSMLIVVPDEQLVRQTDTQFEQFKTKGGDNNEDSNGSELHSSDSGV